MDFQPGEMVEYHSASMNQWIPARVLRSGRGKLDLDCKEGVDLSRVRSPPNSVSSLTSQRSAPAQTVPQLGPAALTSINGPLGLQAGDCCFYKSSGLGWIPATAVRYRPDDRTYDLDVKQQVDVDKIRCIREGMLVEYLSTSTNQWITAQVLCKGQAPASFDLDCKAAVHISRLRLTGDGSGMDPWVTAETAPQGISRADYPPSRKPAPADPKLNQLRQAIQSEDPVELRKRMESRSALNLVGEELDHANHALWVLEARPEALKDLKRAALRDDIDELQAALEAAAVVGVDEVELEAASRRLWALQGKVWRYDAGDGRHLDLRKEPKIDGPRVRQRLNPGDVFDVAEELHGTDGVTYLRLADGRGWAFNHKPGVGTMCVKHYAEEEARRAQYGNQPISLTIKELRNVHQSSMKGARGPRLEPISEDDRPGPYVLVEKTAVTPGPGLCSDAEIITTLSAGTVVDVLEVQLREDVRRMRGRIGMPRGWISLLDTKSGKRWAEQQSY